MRMKTLNPTENFIAQECKKKICLSNSASSVIDKMLGTENPYFISKYMVFYLLANSFTSLQRKGDQENVRFIINEDTVLNIIPLIM
jgi:hypothetical protein